MSSRGYWCMNNRLQASPERERVRAQRGRFAASSLPMLLMFGVLLFWPLVRADGQGFVFNAISPRSVGAGKSLTLTLSVTPLPWDGVIFGHGGAAPANSFPTNASLDSTSGYFAWTPNTNQLGVNRITVWAFEPSAQWVSNYTIFTVTVTNVATPVSGIVIDPIGPQPV